MAYGYPLHVGQGQKIAGFVGLCLAVLRAILVRVALSGSTGLIGSRVFQLLARCNEVVRLGRQADCEIQVDFTDPASVAEVDLRCCDAVVHCAGVIDEDFLENPETAYIHSTVALSTLLDQAIASGVRRFVYFSTAHVYGSLAGRTSEHTEVNPLTDYAIAHYAAEQIVKRRSYHGDLKALVFRPNAVFGVPNSLSAFDRWSLIPYSFPLDAVYKQLIALKTSGEQRRNFVATDDLAIYVLRFLKSAELFDRFTVVNPVGPDSLSVYEFATACAEVYAELTGLTCSVTKPDSSPNEAAGDFVLDSVHDYYRPVGRVRDYLTTFVRQIILDSGRGCRYGL